MKARRQLPGEQGVASAEAGRLARGLILQVVLPIILGLLILAAAGYGLWRVSPAVLSAGADASLVLVAYPLACAGVFPLLIFMALTMLVVRATGWLPGVFGRGRVIAEQVRQGVRRGANMAARPLIMIEAAGAVLGAVGRGLKSFFVSGDGEGHE